MRIVQTRRISQVFFFTLFLWFCIISTIGEEFWQIRAWPVNLFLQLDPLVAIGTILTTHTLYWPLLWALATVVLTIIFGRFFCSWVCPFGSIHHFVGFVGNRKKTTPQKIQLNKYRKAQCIKYFVLIVFLFMAAFPSLASSLQTGLLDPIPLVTRSVNLVLLPILDSSVNFVSVTSRFYIGAWLIFAIFLAAVLLNLLIPRFYCRFVCPLGALFGIIDRFAIWRIGKNQSECINCKLCEKSCEGGCEPTDNIRISECVLCFNCLDDCKHELISYQSQPSLAGEITNPDVSRRGFVLSLASGILAVPAVRLSNKIGSNWFHKVIRPPGALTEEEFLKRCIKCGQCMRICPTNVIQPGGIEGGLENLWTPVLNNRIGSSGCQLNCTACGQVCPTSAIRPVTLDEKHGKGDFAEAGPIKIGTAFFDRNRCLPWAMDKPCIVCEENCPVSPKAIYTQEVFNTVRDGILTVKKVAGNTIETAEADFILDKFATGDYYCAIGSGQRGKITANTENTIVISSDTLFEKDPAKGSKIEIQVRLQRPYVDIEKCIGCGVCEHECPVSGKKAIRVSAEGETRSSDRTLLLDSGPAA
ncbi:MAG: 4Fe-4S binding protein [Sedimentisphaerales bacterium]|nr:4Fe-4S binding protein [Sedimentisphaerales bacterium]